MIKQKHKIKHKMFLLVILGLFLAHCGQRSTYTTGSIFQPYPTSSTPGSFPTPSLTSSVPSPVPSSFTPSYVFSYEVKGQQQVVVGPIQTDSVLEIVVRDLVPLRIEGTFAFSAPPNVTCISHEIDLFVPKTDQQGQILKDSAGNPQVERVIWRGETGPIRTSDSSISQNSFFSNPKCQQAPQAKFFGGSQSLESPSRRIYYGSQKDLYIKIQRTQTDYLCRNSFGYAGCPLTSNNAYHVIGGTIEVMTNKTF